MKQLILGIALGISGTVMANSITPKATDYTISLVDFFFNRNLELQPLVRQIPNVSHLAPVFESDDFFSLYSTKSLFSVPLENFESACISFDGYNDPEQTGDLRQSFIFTMSEEARQTYADIMRTFPSYLTTDSPYIGARFADMPLGYFKVDEGGYEMSANPDFPFKLILKVDLEYQGFLKQLMKHVTGEDMKGCTPEDAAYLPIYEKLFDTIENPKISRVRSNSAQP